MIHPKAQIVRDLVQAYVTCFKLDRVYLAGWDISYDGFDGQIVNEKTTLDLYFFTKSRERRIIISIPDIIEPKYIARAFCELAIANHIKTDPHLFLGKDQLERWLVEATEC